MSEARQMLDLATRIALRGTGLVEPNPLVGCVLVAAGDGPAAGRIIGLGHHTRFGQAHAEVEALASATRQSLGHLVAGCAAYVTLEPCNAWGRQPPCVEALIHARVGRVVCARRDPNAGKGGGAAALIAAGIPCEFTPISPRATGLSDAFIFRLGSPRPWVIAKWAQTIDGKIATRTGESQWISGPRSRRRVHRLRAAVDVILTGIGTVKADDPLLTARDVHVRRVARRVVIDPALDLPYQSRLAKTADQGPVTVVTCRQTREARGIISGPPPGPPPGVHEWVGLSAEGLVDLQDTLVRMRREWGAQTVLVEGGPGLLGRLFDADLIDEAQVYTGPMILADAQAPGPARGHGHAKLADATRFRLLDSRRIDDDVLSIYRRVRPDAAATSGA